MAEPTPTSVTGRLNAPNREAWLRALVEAWRPTIAKIGELPRLRIACGFPSRRALARKRRTIGQCWAPSCSADGTIEIFISPLLDDPFEVAHVVLHEIIHAVVGTEHGHKGPFKRAVRAVGLDGRPTATRPGDGLAAVIRGSILPDLGPYPHASLNPGLVEKVQSTRLCKATCADCGYAVWTTRKWIRVGPPLCARPECPSRGDPMVVDWRGL
jgi:hypothetical protein